MLNVKKLFEKYALLLALFTCYSISGATKEFLPPEQAFVIQGELTAETLRVTFTAQPGYYMYEESMFVKPDNSENSLIPSLQPTAHQKYDPNFQKIVKTYDGRVVYEYDSKTLSSITPLNLVVNVQGCATQGICYPPMQRRIFIQEYNKQIDSVDMSQTATIIKEEKAVEIPWWQASEDLNALNRLLATTSLPVLLTIFFILGIGLAFTPCMLPMLPILSSVVFGTVDHHLLPRKKTVLLALCYILGMACAFSLAGMATAWFGAGITASLQNRWVLIGFGLLMLALSAGLLGFYELQMPHAWQSKVDHWIGKHEGGNIYGVFALGALSSLVASPCVSAPLAGVLTFIAQSGHVQLGGLILFVMACGMGVPLLLFAIGASRIVPRAGKWMIRVQRFFGLLMILLAIWVMLPAFQSFLKGGNDNEKEKRIGTLSYEIVKTKSNLDEKLNNAKAKKIPAIVIFSADWCVSCKELELHVLANEQVIDKLQHYERIEIDITQMTPDQKQLLNEYKIFGPPAILFFNENGQILRDKSVVGVVSPQKFLSHF